MELGEYINPGSPVINLADFSTWQIETDDLTEIDIVKVIESQSVDIQVDALPGETLQGIVSLIKPRSETKAGEKASTFFLPE